MPSTESSRKTLYLIDGSAYIYRAFFALPALNNSKGLQTNAILGFTTTLLKILRERKPDGLVVAFDEKGPTLRHAEFKAYKAQRPPMPEGMSAQIPYIHRVVEALNIPAVRQVGYEADDLIGALAHQAEQAGFDVVIVTGDKDMFQLLTPHVRIYDPVKDKWFGEAECRERFGVEPARVVEIMGLMGDAADNIPGVKGIGEKTAMKLIAQFGTIEELLRRVEEVTPPRIQALLIEQAENARLSRRLATIQLDSPVTFDAATYHMKPPHQDQLIDLLRELEFTTLLKSFQPAFTQVETNAVETELVQDEPSAQRFVEGLPKDGALGLQCLLSPGPGVQPDVQGMALSTGDKTAFIPLDVRTYMRPITALLHDPTRTKVVHDLKSTLLVFHRIGLTLAGPYLDTMVADYLLNPNRRDHQLETIALEVLDHRLGTGHKESAAPQSLFDEDTGSREEAAEA
ncbi:MAG TPA: 5'-3' exonuclease H3TH domain-containing protein, partial [Nitrospiraceae bacterium]